MTTSAAIPLWSVARVGEAYRSMFQQEPPASITGTNTTSMRTAWKKMAGHGAMKGFTLLELVIVLIVLAILSHAVMLRTSATTARGVSTNADQLRQDIAHMQMLAMTWGVPLRLTVAANGASYTVTCRSIGTGCTSLSTPPIDPATGARFTTTLTDGVVVSPANATLNFDSMGRPVNGAVLISANPAASLSVTGGGQSMTVSVYPITGFAVTN